MHATVTLQRVPLGGFGRIRDLLGLIGAIRDSGAPLTTADGLRQAISLLLRVAEMLGVDPRWTERLGAIVRDQRVFNIVLAIVQFVLGAAGSEQEDRAIRVTAGGADVVVDEQSFMEWLPIVLQILSLLKQLRGER